MSQISLNKKRRFGGIASGLNLSAIDEGRHAAGAYSVESKDVIKSMAAGRFGEFDLESLADSLAVSFEGKNADGSYKNPNGLAVAAMLIASASNKPSEYLDMVTSMESRPMAGDVRLALADGSDFEWEYATESFDNQNLLDHMGISIGLNYKIARQGPAMEMVYRTIPLTPETGGIDIEVPNLYVQNTVRHAEDGSESDFGLRRVIDSSIDYQILNDQGTQLLPQHNSTTQAMFVASGVVTPYPYTLGRRTVVTSALLPGKTINLLGLCQDQIQRVGQADYTDALDRNIGIAEVFLTLGSTTLRLDTKGLPYSRFVKSPEQGSRQMKLDFPFTTIILDKDTVDYTGAPAAGAAFDAIRTNEYQVRLKVTLNGTADVERGTININPSSVELVSIKNAAGEAVPTGSGAGQTVANGLATIAVSGWWPDARLTNSNHRYLGLMLNVRSVKERFLTRTRAPFFVPYPLGEDRDQTVMDWLTFAVSTYINNEGVGTLIGYHDRLMRLTGGLRGELTVGDFEENALPIEGIGRYLINPYVQTLSVNLIDAQATQTVNKIENGQETLVNTIRSVAFDILQKTNYENACRYMDGGELTNKWKIALVTSKKIETFMTVKGDSRTLGAALPFQLEADVDKRLDKVMYMTLVRDGEGVDPLSAGIMLLTPTLVSTISVTRDNAPRNEAVVQPRFQHYHLLPIVVKFEIEGVEELLEEALPFKVESDATVTIDGVVQTEEQAPVGP